MQRWKDMLKDTKQERKGQPQKEEKKEEPKEEVVKVSTRYLVGDDVRDTLRKKFIEILQTPVDTDKYDEETNEKAIDIAIKIEELLTSLHKDRKVYSDKARSLIFNLRDPKNPQLKKKVLEEEYQVLQFVTLSPKELANELKKQERDESIKQNLDARRSDWVKEQLQKDSSNKGFFTCKKCGSKNTSYYQMQTRGADEPMTNFITCLDCGNNWKS
mmetsp:Transcript_41188/g.39694  ORF Transcript_41188/g.39694 Transcript_41188/m.39694 type:complete len:215 (+) Transcript_41188:254-898(+)